MTYQMVRVNRGRADDPGSETKYVAMGAPFPVRADAIALRDRYRALAPEREFEVMHILVDQTPDETTQPYLSPGDRATAAAIAWAEGPGFHIVGDRVQTAGLEDGQYMLTDDPRSILVDAFLALHSDVVLSKMLWGARESVSTLIDIVEAQAGRRDESNRALLRQIDDYREARGWSPNGFGGE